MVSGYIHILLNKSLEYSWEPEERDLCLRNKIKTTILQSTLKPASKYRTIKAGKIETCFLYTVECWMADICVEMLLVSYIDMKENFV